MSDQAVYERALRELAECERRVTRLRGFIEMYEEFSGRAAPSGNRPESERPAGLMLTPGIDQSADGALTEADMISRAMEAIEREGRPLDRKELACPVFGVDDPSALTERVLNNLGSRLSRSGKFVNFAKRGKPGYWPKDKPYEPFGYQPSQSEEEGQPEETQASAERVTDSEDGNRSEGLFRSAEQGRGPVNGALEPYGAY